MLQPILLVGFLTIVVYLIRHFYYFYTYWQRHGIKAAKGVTFSWASKPFHEFIMERTRKYGPIYGGYGFTGRFLVVNDPKIARDISIKELHKFPIRMMGYLGKTSITNSLFMMPYNDDWKRIRSILSPAFTTGKLKGMLTPINRISDNFIKHLEPFSKSGEEFDVKMLTSAFAMDVISSCAYGIDIDSLSQPDHPVVTNAKRIMNFDANLPMIISFMFPGLGRLLNLNPFDKKACDFFDKLTFNVIEKRLNSQEHQQNKDMIGLLIEQMQTDTNNNLTNNGHIDNVAKLKGISHNEIAGQGIVFFLAGYDTTNITLCHTIYNLVRHPEWQEKLLEELIEQKSVDYDSMKHLPVLNAIINETLRLFPPLLAIQRSTKHDTTMLDTGIKIPANTSIIFHVYAIHHNPDYFPDPDSFKPERFIGENSAESNPAFMPFGMGHRLCIGMRFAMNELRVALSQLIYNYKLLPDPDLKLEYFKGNLFLSPKKIMIRIKRRDNIQTKIN